MWNYEHNSVIHIYDAKGFSNDDQERRHGEVVRRYRESLSQPYNVEELWDIWDRMGVAYDMVEKEQVMVKVLFDSVTKEEYKMSEYASSLPRVRPPSYWPDVLTDPSIQALNEIQKSILQRQGYHVRFNELYRIVKQLGYGAYGRIYGMTMRTKEVDEKILDILEAADIGGPGNIGMDQLKQYLSSLPKWVALKVSTKRDEALREFLVGREVALTLLPLGIRAVPAYFTLFVQSVADTHPFSYLRRQPTQGDTDSQRRKEKLNAIDKLAESEANLYSVIGRPTGDPKEEVLLYQEYIDGIPLGDAMDDMNENELSIAFCYLHSILSYLWKSLGYVHGDLHMGNILAIKRKSTLPIIEENGKILTYFNSQWDFVFIDQGLAKTDRVAISGENTSYATSQIHDIIYMYRVKNFEDSDVYPLSYQLVRNMLRDDVDVASQPRGGLFLPSVITYKAEGDLTHARIVEALIDSPDLQPYKTTKDEVTLGSTMSLYTDDSYSQGVELIEQAERLLKRYTVPKEGDRTIRWTVREYLRETINYYTSPEERRRKEDESLLAMWNRK